MTATRQKIDSPYPKTYSAFTREAASHQLVVLREEGLYRHLRMQEPGTRMWSWDIITWPGYLAIVGDVADGFTFSRDVDMLDFFERPASSRNFYADGAPSIDFRYWAEKLAHEQRESAREYSADELIRYVTDWTSEQVADEELDPAIADELVQDARSHSEDQHTAVQWISDVFSRHDQDWWDGTDLRDYTFQFLLACYAIDATVQAYRAHQGASR